MGAPTSPSVSLSRLGLPSGHNDTNNSDEKSIQNNSVLFWAAGLPRATEISKGESGFCEGALWGGIGEKMNFRSSRVSTENGSDSPAFSGPASQAVAVYSLRRLTLKDLVPPPPLGSGVPPIGRACRRCPARLQSREKPFSSKFPCTLSFSHSVSCTESSTGASGFLGERCILLPGALAYRGGTCTQKRPVPQA